MQYEGQGSTAKRSDSPPAQNQSIIMRKTFVNSKSLFVGKVNESTSGQTQPIISKKRGYLNMEKDYYKDYRGLYNADVSKFRDIFNQNDISQVPFMSNLRKYTKSSDSKTRPSILSPRFEEAIRPTTSSLTRKRIGDFKTKASSLAPVSFRWHNKSGRNNLWATDYECSLRHYGDQHNPEELNYDALRKPVQYIDFESKEYLSAQFVCPRQLKSFRIKRE